MNDQPPHSESHSTPLPTSLPTSLSTSLSTSLTIALWLDRRLEVTLGFDLGGARLYGIVVNDPSRLGDDDAQAARSSFIDEHHDVYQLIAGAPGVLARSFDAAAVVTRGWAAPLDDARLGVRASRHPQRRRVRAVAVVSDGGIASVVRFEDDPDRPLEQPDRGTGSIVDALEAMWFGDPSTLAGGSLARGIVNARTTRGGCTRWP